MVNTDLAVDVGSGVQEHLDHGLVPADTGVHKGGHALQTAEGRLNKTLNIFYSHTVFLKVFARSSK